MATAIAIRKAILECAERATQAEPGNVEARLHSFIARLSGKMEHMGERDLDATLWKLFETPTAPGAPAKAGA